MNGSFGIRLFSLSLVLLIFSSLEIKAQRSANVRSRQPDSVTSFSPDQQDAIDLLRTLARSLKTESDKPAAAKLQARIADGLWQFDESFARDIRLGI